MERIYPIVDHKTCKGCGKDFKRNKNYFGKQWESIEYCSRKCSGGKTSKRQLERFKDETKHPRWRGDSAGYFAMHDWITKHYGQPKKCEICKLNDPLRVYHWANLTGNYKRDISDWKRMCVSCHRKYDYSRK